MCSLPTSSAQMPFTYKCLLTCPTRLEVSDFLNGVWIASVSFIYICIREEKELGPSDVLACFAAQSYACDNITWFLNSESTYPYCTTPISGPAGPMSSAWAMSARNCFWMRNRRLPMLVLPSIKNDKSTLQSEEWKRALLFWSSLIAFPCAFSCSPLAPPASP